MAEGAFAASVADPSARMKGALLAAQQILLSFGITSVQEAATMASAWGPLTELDRSSKRGSSATSCSRSRAVTGATGCDPTS
jgi:predicted amidohydrolase YtcJ